jgi:RNA polymerase sigma factor (sigma-70 family)
MTYLGLVRGIASRYQGYGLPFDDLVQEGSLGLLEAIDRYEPSRGLDFPAYARFRVRRAIRNALTDEARIIRLPRHIVDRQRLLSRTEAELAAAGNRMPSPDELAAATGLPVDSVAEARNAAAVRLSLDVPATVGGAAPESMIADDTALDPELEAIGHERADRLASAVAALPPQRRHVIEQTFGLGGEARGVREVAASLHITPQRARSVANAALSELHRTLARPEPPTGDGRERRKRQGGAAAARRGDVPSRGSDRRRPRRRRG